MPSGLSMHGWDEPARLVRVGIALLVFVLATGTIPDPDLWGHVRFGRSLLPGVAAGGGDPYSFTADLPWINHEWLAEIVMYAAYAAAGSSGLVALKTIIVFLLLEVARRAVSRHTCRSLVVDFSLLALTIGILWRIQTVRPQIFSLLLFGILLTAITEADRGRPRALIAVPIVMAVWANVHGAWIVGAGALLIWALPPLLAGWPSGRRELPIVACLSGIAATLINPYGLGLWRFIARTVRFARPGIAEWSSIGAIPLGAAVPWIIALAGGAVVLVRSGLPRERRYLLILAGLAIAAFRTNRLDAFLAVAVALLLAPQIGAAFGSGAGRGEGLDMSSSRATARAVTLIAVGTMLLAAAGPVVKNLRCIPLTAEWMPESEAAEFVREHRLAGRLLVWFDWGEYAIWHFGSDIKVSIDGRRETVYSDRLLAAHFRFYRGEPGAEAFPDEIGANVVWLPVGLPAVDALRRAGWIPVFEGPRSLILQRPPTTTVRIALARPNKAARCFPGP